MTKPLSFNERGYLSDIGKIEMEETIFFDTFVKSMESSKTRAEIYTTFKRYNNDLSQLLKCPFVQWVDGSFVTQKNNPRDIDVVTFIPYEVYQRLQDEIDHQFSKFSVGYFYDKIDAYTVWEYPEKHASYRIFQSDWAYWYDCFSKTKPNHQQKRFSKSFIQLNINPSI